MMMEADMLLEETPVLKLTVTGRKTGLKHIVSLWFAYEEGRLYILAHKEAAWWKNVLDQPKVEVEVSEVAFNGLGRLAPHKRTHVYKLFQKKYGDRKVENWYGKEDEMQREVLEVELGRVIGKRPGTGATRLEQLISIA